MDKFFIRLNHKSFFTFIIVFSLISVITAAGFFWVSYKTAQSTVGNEIFTKQEIIVKASSQAIEQYIEGKMAELSLIAHDPDVLAEDLNMFITPEVMRKQGIVDIILFDTGGNIAKILTVEGAQTPPVINFSDRVYYKFASNADNQGKVFIGEPIIARTGANSGKPVIPIATGIFEKGVLQGVLAIGLSPDYFTDQFIDPLIDDNTRISIITGDKNLIFNKYTQLNGTNLVDYANSKNWDGKEEYLQILERITQAEEGVGVWNWIAPDEETASKRIIGYIPIKFDSTTWYLIISSPSKILDDPLKHFTFNQSTQFAITLFFLIIIIIAFDLGLHIANKDGYERAIKDIHSDIKSRSTKK